LTELEDKGRRRITVELPNHLITRLDELKREWGLRARGDLLVRLLEELFAPQESLLVEETETSSTTQTKESARELNGRHNLLIETEPDLAITWAPEDVAELRPVNESSIIMVFFCIMFNISIIRK